MKIKLLLIIFIYALANIGCQKREVRCIGSNGKSWFEPTEPSLFDPTMGPSVWSDIIIGRVCNETKLLSYLSKNIINDPSIQHCDIFYFSNDDVLKDIGTTVTFPIDGQSVECDYYSKNNLTGVDTAMALLIYENGNKEMYSFIFDESGDFNMSIIKQK